MKTIVISGTQSGIGKTSLAEEILRNLPNWSALKVTVKRRSGCPRNNSCVVCDDIKKDFDIITDKQKIREKGTDTARLKKAGAKKVIWLKATLEGLEGGIKESFFLLKKSKGVVIEGTSVLKFMKPDITIFLKDKTSQIRKSAKEAERKADIIIDVSKPIR